MKYFNFSAAALLVLIYSLANIPPSERLNLWIVSFIIPFALVLNIVLLLAGIMFRKKSSIFFLAALAFGSTYLFGTIGLKSLWRNRKVQASESFTVLNYNLSGLNAVIGPNLSVSRDRERDSIQSSMVDWVLSSRADIQCYQEFLNAPASAHIDILKALRDNGFHYYFSAEEGDPDGTRFGTLIASRFPLVSEGDVLVSRNGFNRIAFADVAFGSDTIRIINVHLQSMEMKRFNPVYSETIEDQTRNIQVVLRKLKFGVFERSNQIRQLIKFIERSPYPVICAGDFNELPYSYSYQILKKRLKNSFEESGRGFGFSYNGNTMRMLRIDNQFYSPRLLSVDFRTIDTVRFSDHFPLLGKYVIAD